MILYNDLRIPKEYFSKSLPYRRATWKLHEYYNTTHTRFLCAIPKSHHRYFVVPSTYMLTAWVAVVGLPSSSFSVAASVPLTLPLHKI